MVGKVTFKIHGGKELEKALRDAGPKIATRIGGKALRAGVRPIVREAKRLAPKRTGELRRSIIAVRDRRAKPGAMAVLIGFRKGAARRYAHLVEFGTSRSAAKPFLRPALDSQAEAALNEMIDTLAKGILRQEWKKTLANIAEGDELDLGID